MITLSGLFAAGYQDVWASGVVKNEFKAYMRGEERPTLAEPKPQK